MAERSCMDCKHGWLALRGTQWLCDWQAPVISPPPLPVFLQGSTLELKTLGDRGHACDRRVPVAQPYTDCPAWEARPPGTCEQVTTRT
jgi:hypothetical protein